jgi:amino acid transporter
LCDNFAEQHKKQEMKLIKIIILSIIIFAFSAYFASLFEETYRNLIRYLFEALSQNKISFFVPLKDFHYISEEFVICFALFILSLVYFFKRHSKEQNKTNSFLVILFLILSTIVLSAIQSKLEIMQCTWCEDGKKKIDFSVISFDGIFIGSLFLAILPSIITEIKNLKKNDEK